MVWDVATRECVKVLGEEQVRGQYPVGPACMALTRDGRTLALAEPAKGRNEVALYDLTDFAEVHRWSLADGEELSRMAFSPDGKILATFARHESSLRLREAATGEEVVGE